MVLIKISAIRTKIFNVGKKEGFCKSFGDTHHPVNQDEKIDSEINISFHNKVLSPI